jgi:hypothetical protein
MASTTASAMAAPIRLLPLPPPPKSISIPPLFDLLRGSRVGIGPSGHGLPTMLLVCPQFASKVVSSGSFSCFAVNLFLLISDDRRSFVYNPGKKCLTLVIFAAYLAAHGF